MEGTLPGQAFTSLGTGQPWRAVSSGSAMPQDVKAIRNTVNLKSSDNTPRWCRFWCHGLIAAHLPAGGFAMRRLSILPWWEVGVVSRTGLLPVKLL